MKTCSRCNSDKPLGSFGANKRARDGLQAMCKECKREYQRIWRAEHKDKVRGHNSSYYIAHRTGVLTRCKAYKSQHHTEVSTRQASYRCANAAGIKTYKAAYFRQNKDRAYALRRSREKEYPQVKLGAHLRTRLRRAIKRGHKAGSAVRDLGCSISQCREHIESQFRPGMSWDNWARDGWHLDHRVPLSSFDLTDKKQFQAACHYTNLQPLWATENLKKGAKRQI
jgi:hypothetical protein